MLIRMLLAVGCLTIIAGCCITQPMATSSNDTTLDVRVFYRERIMLPPGSQLEVTLADVSKMDVKAETIGTITQDITTGPPYSVSLSYSEDQILPKHRYNLKARITNNGELLFISTSAIDPFATEKRPVEILTEKVNKAPAKPNATLKNTRWRLLNAKGKEITLSEGQSEPYMLLELDSARVRGFGGCNNFTGGYMMDGNNLSFSQIASTMRACLKGMEEEQLFHAVLAETATYAITGDTLKLLDSSGSELANFAAIYLQ